MRCGSPRTRIRRSKGMSTDDVYAGEDPRDISAYTVGEVARFLRMPASTLRWWALGREYVTDRGIRKVARPVIRKSKDKPLLMSFWDLVEAHVLATIRREHEVPLQNVRKALDFVTDKFGIERPLIDQDFHTDRVDLFVDLLNYDLRDRRAVLNVSRGGKVESHLVKAGLMRVDRDVQGLVAKLYPWLATVGEPSDAEPRVVAMDPRLSFGRPVISGTGVAVAVLYERRKGGDTVAEIARDYRLDPGMVEVALRWFAGGSSH